MTDLFAHILPKGIVGGGKRGPPPDAYPAPEARRGLYQADGKYGVFEKVSGHEVQAKATPVPDIGKASGRTTKVPFVMKGHQGIQTPTDFDYFPNYKAVRRKSAANVSFTKMQGRERVVHFTENVPAPYDVKLKEKRPTLSSFGTEIGRDKPAFFDSLRPQQPYPTMIDVQRSYERLHVDRCKKVGVNMQKSVGREAKVFFSAVNSNTKAGGRLKKVQEESCDETYHEDWESEWLDKFEKEFELSEKEKSGEQERKDQKALSPTTSSPVKHLSKRPETPQRFMEASPRPVVKSPVYSRLSPSRVSTPPKVHFVEGPGPKSPGSPVDSIVSSITRFDANLIKTQPCLSYAAPPPMPGKKGKPLAKVITRGVYPIMPLDRNELGC